ncbi:hypothetical protein PDIDSM_1593 [Penicillium digitatum]|nr:hypothetical protein PDIDSM_1593 [Penicillium digitatum]
METISLESTNSKTSHKRLPNKEPKRDDSVTKSGKSRVCSRPPLPRVLSLNYHPRHHRNRRPQWTLSLPSTKPLELPDLPPSEFIYPASWIWTTHESVSDNPSEQLTEVSTPYTPVLHAVSQYNQRIRSHCGSKCETWLTRQMYDELGDISTRIEKIMHGITVMLEEREARDEFASP